MYSIHYHIKMHESSLKSQQTESVTEKQMFRIDLMRWFKKKA
ncbi:hypothetical protein [Paenibacillus psychroresistens]|nr:hypothetical protein [Paenibacillus psychroresistens]